jgi:predicted O-methyltransferase YrrM
MNIKHSIDVKIYNTIFKLSPLYYTRPMTNFLKERYNHPLIGVEIGVDKGYNSKNMLLALSIKKLYLIDPYTSWVSNGKKLDYASFEKTKKMLRNFEDKIEIIKKTSEDAINDIPDGLDFVYIDGNHDYEYVKKDIKMYYPKIKEGGVIGGHDFNATSLGVVKAVTEYFGFEKLQAGAIDWWVVK